MLGLPLLLSAPHDSLLYLGHYNLLLVTASVVVAIFAAWSALLVAERVRGTDNLLGRRMWIVAGGLAMGIGVWAMHFIGMLAFSLPCKTGYDPLTTALSVIPGIFSSMLAIAVISQPTISARQLVAGGVLMGVGIGAMHYTGMAAYQMDGLIRYDVALFGLSLLVAVGMATLGLWIKFYLQPMTWRWQPMPLLMGALILGGAVSSMHYTAMMAAYFVRGSPGSTAGLSVTPEFLATIILLVTGSLIGLTLLFIQLPKLLSRSLRQSLPLIGGLMLLWMAFAWQVTDRYTSYRQAGVIQQANQDARFLLDRLHIGLNSQLDIVRGAAEILATSPLSNESLLHLRAPSAGTLAKFNARIAAVSRSLGVATLIVLNEVGDCIASSDSGGANTDVGRSFAARDFFQQARLGKSGYYYAAELNSHEPGLYYVRPIIVDGRFVGTVVAKYPLSLFRKPLAGSDALIVDKQGVVLLADDRQVEFRTIPNATARNLPDSEVQRRYLRSLGSEIQVIPWSGHKVENLHHVDQLSMPVLIIRQPLPVGDIEIRVHKPLPEFLGLVTQEFGLFLILALVGDLLILSVMGFVLHLQAQRREAVLIRQHDAELGAALDKVNQANRALAERKAELQAIFNSTEVGIFLIGLNARISDVNSRVSDIFQYPRAMLLGMPYLDLLSPAQAVEAPQGRSRLREDDTPYFHKEQLFQRRNGERFWGEIKGRPFYDAKGHMSGIVGVLTDITRRKQVEDELLDYQNRLEALVEQRHAALRIAKEAAERANRGKSFFLANVSHELRTPMNSIMGFTELARNSSSDPKVLGQLDHALDSSRKLLSLINDLIDYSQLEKGQLQLRCNGFDLAEVLAKLRQHILPLAEAKGLVVELVVSSEVPRMLVGDAQRLGRLLAHYADNAVKFTDKGHIRISVVVENSDTDSVSLRFTVCDTGIGLSAVEQTHLFQGFEQIDGSSTRRFGGAGIGLATVLQLATLMQGKVGVDSQPGQGSSFWLSVRLPLDGNAPQAHLLAAPFVGSTVTAPPAQQASGAEQTPVPIADMDWPLADAVCRQLMHLFERDDFAAQKLLTDNTALLEQFAPAAVHKLSAQVEQFDFESAINTLRDIMQLVPQQQTT